MSGVLPLDLVIQLVRYRMYEAIAVDGLEVVQTAYLAGKIGEGVTPSFIRTALNQLEELKEIKFEAHPGQLTIIAERRSAALTPGGIRKVEKELRDSESIISIYRDNGLVGLEDDTILVRGIPASDRIVLQTDNQEAHDAAVNALSELEKELETNNVVGDALGDLRQIAMLEVNVLKKISSGQRVRAEPLIALARKSLLWIAEKAGSASVSDIAKRALSLLIDWLSF